MALTVVTAHTGTNHSSTPSVTMGGVPTVGNSIIACFGANGDQGLASLSDNNSNSGWVQVVQALDPSGGNSSATSIWWLPSVTTPGTSFVLNGVSTTPGEGATYGMSAIEVSGLTGTVDQIGSANGASVNTLTATCGGPNVSPIALAVAVINTAAGDATAFAVGPTWGSGGGSTIYLTTGGGQGVKSSSGYKILSAIETTSAAWSWTTVGPSAAVVATFKGGSPPVGAGPAARCIYVMP